MIHLQAKALIAAKTLLDHLDKLRSYFHCNFNEVVRYAPDFQISATCSSAMISYKGREMYNKKSASLIAISIALASPLSSYACASCGCTLSSDWENLGFSSSSGFKIDVRYDYLNQDQLRTGTHSISPSAVANGNAEIEKYTRNNYLTVGIDYSTNPDWGLNVQLPYINRKHKTLGASVDGETAGEQAYYSSTSSVGDIKVIGRYQGFTEQHNFGVLLGLKLPTGAHTKIGSLTDGSGYAGIDRGLQPGTGSTDVILGVYHVDSFNKDWGYFTQAIVQKPLNISEGYKTGDSLNLNFGLRYEGFDDFIPQLQLNARFVEHDHGLTADGESYATGTGGTLIYLSPGLTYRVNKQVKVYGYMQLPIYQDVNDLQLTSRWTGSVGFNYAF